MGYPHKPNYGIKQAKHVSKKCIVIAGSYFILQLIVVHYPQETLYF